MNRKQVYLYFVLFCFLSFFFFFFFCKFIKFKLSFYFFFLFLAMAQSLMVKNGKRWIFITWNLSQFLHGEWPLDIQRNFTSDWPQCLIMRDPVAMNTDGLGQPYVITYTVIQVFFHFLRVIVCNSGTQMRVRDSSATRIFFLKNRIMQHRAQNITTKF